MSWLSCVANIPIVAGIPAEVWVAEKLPGNPDDPYSTIEIFFADPEYTVQIGRERHTVMFSIYVS